MAKSIGPSRSPMVLDTPKPRSAKAEDHWLTACSDAPAQTIISIINQKTPWVASCPNPAASPISSSNFAMGTPVNNKKSTAGTMHHKRARILQFAIPATAKKTVLNSTTATWPQQ